tara:strand:- start:308 stop:430 length:123 start_codon:yes stop_codon:yes gene_type:complete
MKDKLNICDLRDIGGTNLSLYYPWLIGGVIFVFCPWIDSV